MVETGHKNLLLEQVDRDYKLYHEHSYSVIHVPSSQDGSVMKKMIWPRVNFPSEVHRWNTPEEIVSYLISFDSHSKWMTSQQLHKPPSGSMWLFNKNEGNKTNYKTDGYDWKTRSSTCKTIREDRTKLKVCGHILLYGVYTHCESNSSFHRRSYWLIKNPSIILIHYLDISHRRACTAVTVKKYFEQDSSSFTDASPYSTLLLTVSDEHLCQYLSSTATSTCTTATSKDLLSSLSQSINDIAHKLLEQNEPVSTATLVTCIQKTLFPSNSITDTPPDKDHTSTTENHAFVTAAKRKQLIDLLLHHQKTMRSLQATPTQLLLPKGTELHCSFMSTTPTTPIIDRPHPPLQTPTIQHNNEEDFVSLLRPPSLDTIQSLLPVPLDIDHTPSITTPITTMNNTDTVDMTVFAQSLLTMRPLADVSTLHNVHQTATTCNNLSSNSTSSNVQANSTSSDVQANSTSSNVQANSTSSNVQANSWSDGEKDDFLTDEFLNHFLYELNTGGVPSTTATPPTVTPTPNNDQSINGSSSSDHTPFQLELDPESVKLLTELYKEEMTPSIAPPLSPVSQYMASLNGGQEVSELSTSGYRDNSYHDDISDQSTNGYHDSRYHNNTSNQSTSGYHNDGYHNDLSYQENGFHDNSYYMNDPSLLLSVNESHPQTNDAFSFANSFLQQPSLSSHTPSLSTASSLSPAHIMTPLEDYRSPVHSPSSPASLSSLSTGGSDPPLVAELCELMSESPNVQQTDFSHLSLSGSEQQELLQASRVIQKTLRRCKERPNSMVTLKEKNAALLIERCYKRYREIKDRRDQAARCIQTQYRLYRRRNDELQRAALFIQQMYRYQRRRRCNMSSLATHSHGGGGGGSGGQFS